MNIEYLWILNIYEYWISYEYPIYIYGILLFVSNGQLVPTLDCLDPCCQALKLSCCSCCCEAKICCARRCLRLRCSMPETKLETILSLYTYSSIDKICYLIISRYLPIYLSIYLSIYEYHTYQPIIKPSAIQPLAQAAQTVCRFAWRPIITVFCTAWKRCASLALCAWWMVGDLGQMYC